MNILGIDTATLYGSTAIVNENGVLSECISCDKVSFSKKLLSMIDQTFSKAAITPKSIDAIAVSKGPGSFTGIRIGLATAYGISFALNKKIIGISSLEAIAHSYLDTEGLICPIIDARRNEVYATLFNIKDNSLVSASNDLVISPSNLCKLIKEPITFLGSDAKNFEKIFKKELNTKYSIIDKSQNLSTATSTAKLAFDKLDKNCQNDLKYIIPNYIRPSDAEICWDLKQNGGK